MDNYKEDKQFLNIIKFIDITDKYDDQKLYKIYNVIKNIKNWDIIVVYNSILNIIKNINSYNINSKDNEFLKRIFNSIKIIKNLNPEKLNISEVEIYVNYYIYKTIDKNTFQEIIIYLKKLENENDKNLYIQLWNKLLSPEEEKIIDRNIDYYIDYNNTTLENITIINFDIVNNYIDELIKNKIKKIKYSFIPNIEILFFLLLTYKI